MTAENKLTVFAEFGGAYLWIKPASDQTARLGLKIGNARNGVPQEYRISPLLQEDFRAWIVKWETTVLPKVEYGPEKIAPKTFWEEINGEGMALANRLKSEVGKHYMVEYHPPWHETGSDGNWHIIPSSPSPNS